METGLPDRFSQIARKGPSSHPCAASQAMDKVPDRRMRCPSTGENLGFSTGRLRGKRPWMAFSTASQQQMPAFCAPHLNLPSTPAGSVWIPLQRGTRRRACRRVSRSRIRCNNSRRRRSRSSATAVSGESGRAVAPSGLPECVTMIVPPTLGRCPGNRTKERRSSGGERETQPFFSAAAIAPTTITRSGNGAGSPHGKSRLQ